MLIALRMRSVYCIARRVAVARVLCIYRFVLGRMLHKRQGQHPMFRTVGTPPRSQRPSLFSCHNAHVPKAPHRRLQHDSPTALGVGRASTRIPLLVEKPIVRSPRPSEFNECLRADIEGALPSHSRAKPQSTSFTERLPSIVTDEHILLLAKKRLYTSTTREATEEAALPTPRRNVPQTTLEREADPVRYRATRYLPRPSVWQHYAREWDAMQLRRSDSNDCDLTLPQITGKSCNLLCQNHTDGKITNEKNSKIPRQFVFLRPMPGYGGFVPRHAVEPHNDTETDSVSDTMCSTARRTYRHFPTSEYKVLEHAHKGPFSKTVTMTHPLNPFNKVESKAHSL